jgi:4-hydroxybenzoate polyprenyltransferase
LAIDRQTAAAAEKDDVVERRGVGRAAALIDLSRGRQAFLSVAQPGLAAVLALGGLPSLRVSLTGVVAATAGYLAVFSLNNLLERRFDAAAARVGARRAARFGGDGIHLRRPPAGDELGLRFSVLWIVSLGTLSAVLAYTLAPLCLVVVGVAVALDLVYGALRAVTPWKTVVAGAVVGLAGLAGWAAVAPLSLRALTVFGFLALWEIGGRDIAGDLADVDIDRRRGVTSFATVYGPPAAARAVCVVGFATLAATITLPMPGGMLNDLALVAGVFVVAWPGAKLWHQPTSAEAAAYFDRVSLYPAAVLAVALLPALAGAL